MRGYDCNKDNLDAGEAAQRLDVRNTRGGSGTPCKLPRRYRGEGVKKAMRDRDMTIGRQMYRAKSTRSTFHDENGNAVTRDEAAER